jgi:hypothetical protein
MQPCIVRTRRADDAIEQHITTAATMKAFHFMALLS